MPSLVAEIRPTSSDSKWAYAFEVDGVLNTNVSGVANASAALDAIKALVIAQGGAIDRIHIVVGTH